jgi:hypothetical protein
MAKISHFVPRRAPSLTRLHPSVSLSVPPNGAGGGAKDYAEFLAAVAL